MNPKNLPKAGSLLLIKEEFLPNYIREAQSFPVILVTDILSIGTIGREWYEFKAITQEGRVAVFSIASNELHRFEAQNKTQS